MEVVQFFHSGVGSAFEWKEVADASHARVVIQHRNNGFAFALAIQEIEPSDGLIVDFRGVSSNYATAFVDDPHTKVWANVGPGQSLRVMRGTTKVRLT